MTETRNSKTLADFVAYCEAYPSQRFWQALRNWSGYQFVLVSDFRPPEAGPEDIILDRDTFYWEGRRGSEE